MSEGRRRMRGGLVVRGSFWLQAAAAIALTASGGLAARTSAEPVSSPPEMLEDAELTDVFFLDPDRGWAVGDRGVIWATEDGGRHWRLQDSPVNCRLESVHFVDEKHGWAAGGWIHPYTHNTTGVVVRTLDGGRRWAPLALPTLPALKQVRFADCLRGWAVGNASPMYGSGVFHTGDGGRSWTAVPGVQPQGWLSAHFCDPQHGVLAGRNGELATLSNGDWRPASKPAVGLQGFRAMALAGATGWVVGDGGLVLHTADGGNSWALPPSPLPAELGRQFDWRCVAAVGPRCWIAGAPGSLIAHSADGGRGWQVFATGQTAPIRRLMFLDERWGWAVGSLGSILASRDGGRTWQRQKGERQSAALLAIVSEPDHIPLELLTRLSGDEGYVGAVELVNRRDVETPLRGECSWEERAHAATAAVGGSQADAAWQFPVRQAGLHLGLASILAGWDTLHGGRSTSLLEEHVVRRIRQWRPQVVVTQGASPSGQEPLGHLIQQIVLSAVRQAADPAAYREQLAVAGLPAWKVRKVLAASRAGEADTLTLETTRLATRLGSSLADYASAARGLVARQWRATPASVGYRLLMSDVPAIVGPQDFFAGLSVPAGGPARRAPGMPAGTSLETLSKLAQRRRNIQALLARLGEDPGGGAAWLAQAEDLIRGVSPSAGGEILYQLSQSYRDSGRSELAADALHMLTERFPEHPLAEGALLWLVAYWGSGEVDRWLRAEPPRRLPYLAARAAGDASPASAADAFPHPPLRPLGRAARAAALAESIRQNRPALFAAPEIQFPLAALERRQGNGLSNALYPGLVRSQLPARWRNCARGELWLAEGRGLSPKPLLECPLVAERPRLDGRLEDSCWEKAARAQLKSAFQDDAEWPAEVRLAHDGQFLLVAVRCGKAPSVEYPAGEGPRPRDPDLNGCDRVDLLLDVDRDYVTCFRLTVDHRGWTGESCFGDTHWDPQWYVAAQSDASQWTVEAAIPLDELTSQPPRPGGVWSIGLQRVVPGVGFQAWSQPAAVAVAPEGFGYLLFRGAATP